MDLIAILSILLLVILIPIALGGISMAPYLPSRNRDLETINKGISLTDGESFLELGCGDGRVSTYIAKNNPNANILGIEYAFPIYFMAKIRQILSKQKNLKIKLGDGFKQNFGDFDVIYLYGMPEALEKKIVPKFLKESKSGQKLVSYVFSIKNKEYLKQLDYKMLRIDERNVGVNVYVRK